MSRPAAAAKRNPRLGPEPPALSALDPTGRTRKRALRRFVEEVIDLVENSDPRRFAWEVVAHALPDFSFRAARTQAFRMLGYDVRKTSSLLGRVIIVGGRAARANLRIGPGCIIAPDVTFGLDGPITLGKNVSIGPRATLYTATHALGAGSRRMSVDVMVKPIVVEDGAWIGMDALILPGVRVGQGAVVASGAVVSTDVPPNTLVAGNPAAVVEKLPFADR